MVQDGPKRRRFSIFWCVVWSSSLVVVMFVVPDGTFQTAGKSGSTYGWDTVVSLIVQLVVHVLEVAKGAGSIPGYDFDIL